MLKPINWKNFPRNFAVIQFGFALFGFAIVLLIRAHLGTNPWAVLEVALADLTHVKAGTMSIAVGFLVLAAALLLREQVGWGTLTNIIFIGLWVNFFLDYVPEVHGPLWLQAGMVLLSIAIHGVASAIYIGVNAGAGPRDSLMLARTTGRSIQLARLAIGSSVVLAGWLLGGPLGLGTLASALLIGPAVQLGFKTFNVKTSQPNPKSQ
jgi:uncharacterized membrane protein YczE